VITEYKSLLASVKAENSEFKLEVDSLRNHNSDLHQQLKLLREAGEIPD